MDDLFFWTFPKVIVLASHFGKMPEVTRQAQKVKKSAKSPNLVLLALPTGQDVTRPTLSAAVEVAQHTDDSENQK